MILREINIVVLTCLAFAFLWDRPANAQLAPTGAHYAGRASDTGHTGPNAGGGYAASVALELPPARGGLPVPVQIVSGSRGFGAAGLGWDVPLAYVLVDKSFAHRRPVFLSGLAAVQRKRITVVLPGRRTEMVLLPSGDTWVGRNQPDLVMKQDGTDWKVFDGNGLTYTFNADPHLFGAGLYLLHAIDGAGGSKVLLQYAVAPVTLPTSPKQAISVDLVSVKYNPHPTDATCFKHEVSLLYAIPFDPKPQSLNLIGESAIVRDHRLVAVDVLSRPNCSSPPEQLRRYDFSYDPDPDTKQDRLSAVDVFGRHRPSEPTTSLPVAAYTYGSAISPNVQSPSTLAYAQNFAQSVPLPATANSGLGETVRMTNGLFQSPYSSAPYVFATPQSLIDMTGDGRPDLVWHANGKLWLARNVAGPNGPTFAPTVLLNDNTFKRPVLDARSSKYERFNGPANSAENQDNVWMQTIDVNGDGRIDIVDAAEKPDYWIVYLNTPDSTVASGIKWVRRAYRIDRLYRLFASRGMAVESGYLPLSRRFTGRDYGDWTCWRWFPSFGAYIRVSLQTYCPDYSPDVHKPYRGPEKTFTEWEFKDINGDGYPDVVFNSSPVEFRTHLPTEEDHPNHEIVFERRDVLVAPEQSNRIEAVLNVGGLFIKDDSSYGASTDPFSAESVLVPRSECGVGQWMGPDPGLVLDPERSSFQMSVCDISDVNGDGLADRIVDTSVQLGTGYGFSGIYMALPDRVGSQFTTYYEHCDPDDDLNPFVSNQIQGLRDLTGDGIPDYIQRIADGTYYVHVGTGMGFRTPVRITGPFEISQVDEICPSVGTFYSRTARGLFDMDGDGFPERVSISPSQTNIDIYPLAGGAANILAAGRITRVDNGYGALTNIRYASAKNDASTRHQVPSPEVVVDMVETTDADGGLFARTYYAYGGLEQFYDPIVDAFRTAGYLRRVELRTTSSRDFSSRDGIATITDAYPLQEVSPQNPLLLSREARFGRYLQVGRTKDVTLLSSGAISPWSLLTADMTTDTRRIGATHYQINLVDTKLFLDETPWFAGCADVLFPYDYNLSYTSSSGQPNLCTARGFLFTKGTTTWRGSSGPPSTHNVQTQTAVRSVDDYGRVTSTFYRNDIFVNEDDVCVDVTYANPVGTNERVLSAIKTRKVWSGPGCNERDGSVIVYAEDLYEYDKLVGASVSQGLLTAHVVYRHATDTGAYLSTVREFDVDYDANANPYRIIRWREDGAQRTATNEYDTFGLVPWRTSVAGTNVPTLVLERTLDPVSLEVTGTLDWNGSAHGTAYDRFGRPVLETVDAQGIGNGVVASRTYLGFEGGVAGGRRVVVKEFADPIDANQISIAEGRILTTYFDEVGRPKRSEAELGDDYAYERLVLGARKYDGFGRVVFEADPYRASQPDNTAYGTTRHYWNDGSLWLVVRGPGPQPATTVPDPSLERYATAFTHTFANSVETVTSQGPDAFTAGSPQYGTTRQQVFTAIGRNVSRSTWQNGVRLEFAAITHDRLGQQAKMVRYQDAYNGAGPVVWSWQLDSLGQLLRLTEPSSTPQERIYSDFGELKQVAWHPPVPEASHAIYKSYDALGRLTYSEEQNEGVTDPETVNKYGYDIPGPSPLINPTNVLGQLAIASGPTGDIVFSYDGLGRTNGRSYTDTAQNVYVDRQGFHADGSPSWIELNLPDNNYQTERAEYAYDSAGRLRWMWFSEGVNTQDLYQATEVDAWGRTRSALFGNDNSYVASYADVGRRLPKSIAVSSTFGTRSVAFDAFDPVGRELLRHESTTSALVQTSSYNAIGQLYDTTWKEGGTTTGQWVFSSDNLGNLTLMRDIVAGNSVFMSSMTTDRDRICRIGYGGGLGGTACNVGYDSFGNIVEEPTRTGYNKLSYFNSGNVRRIENESGNEAGFRYDPFGDVQELSIRNHAGLTMRADRHYGPFITQREQMGDRYKSSYISRRFPSAGLVVSRRGRTGPWIFAFSESRGTRFTTNENGIFVQDFRYSPYGETSSTGAAPGMLGFTTEQWNDGSALDGFGLVHLGARIYDPAIGRFLSRDPLALMETAATSNPYGFAFNDPLNVSDRTGLAPNSCAGNPTCISATYEQQYPGIVGAAIAAGIFVFSLLDVDDPANGALVSLPLQQPRFYDPSIVIMAGSSVDLSIEIGGLTYPPIYDASGMDFSWSEVPPSMLLDIGLMILSVVAIQPEFAAIAYARTMGWTELRGLAAARSVATATRGVASSSLRNGFRYAREVLEGGTGDAFAGHGELRYLQRPSTTTIPEGTTLTVWTEEGGTITDAVGNLIETGQFDRIPLSEGARSYLPRAEVPNYVLKAPTRLRVYSASRTVEDATALSELLKENMGHCQWAACLQIR